MKPCNGHNIGTLQNSKGSDDSKSIPRIVRICVICTVLLFVQVMVHSAAQCNTEDMQCELRCTEL
jgi:hypothetical protein